MSANHIVKGVSAARQILFVVPQPYFAHRGSPLRVLTALRALIELGFEVDLLVYGIGEDRELEGVKIHRCWNPPFVNSDKGDPASLLRSNDFGVNNTKGLRNWRIICGFAFGWTIRRIAVHVPRSVRVRSAR